VVDGESEVRTEGGVPIANPDGAAIVGERIRTIVEGATFTDDSGAPLRRVTVSIGIAAFPEHAVNVDDLVAAADRALYAAKGSGKNRVVVSEAEV
jgi:diguanylate cyclase (GGDEF)-like protein